jgi:HD superfamily phosphohydrolase
MTSHFLFVAGALRERSSRESADLQLTHQIWGLRSALISENVQRYLSAESCGLIYVLKEGLCAHFSISSGVQPLDRLDALVRDELRTEARYGYVAITRLRRWQSSSEQSLAALRRVLEVPDQAELTRRLNLGMHRLTQEQHEALLKVEGTP